MAIKNLLVAYNGGEASDSALHLALQMASKYDAHLTGIMAHNASNVTRNVPSWLSKTMLRSIAEVTAQRTVELASKFQKITEGKIARDKRHWLEIKADPDRAISYYTRSFDITVLGQYENLMAADELEWHPDRIANNSGRPIIVAPKNYRTDAINERAVVGWDGRRTSARALSDAMQVLETKDHVTIVTVGDAKNSSQPHDVNLVTALERHGIEAEHKCVSKDGTIADTLLSECRKAEAGLLVVGAYEHSKIYEDLFGGVTSEILSKAHLPLFLSH